MTADAPVLKPKLRWPLWAAGAAAVLVLAGTAGYFGVQLVSNGETQVSQDKNDEVEQITAAKVAIEQRLPDVTSTTYGKVFVHWDDTLASVCGTVDLVEPQDSFDGQERFVYSDGGLLLEEIDGSDAITRKWRDVCE